MAWSYAMFISIASRIEKVNSIIAKLNTLGLNASINHSRARNPLQINAAFNSAMPEGSPDSDVNLCNLWTLPPKSVD